MCLNILISPNARTLNMVKKIPRQLGQWNPLETCLNMPLVLEKFLGPFLRKCILKNSNLYIENIYTTNNITDLPKENCCSVLFISKKHCKNI